jgi:hypothetical protein
MSCKGICIRHKAVSNHYANGQKRCRICQLFIKWDGLWCPCCRCRLRTRPRSFKFKRKLREEEKRIEDAKENVILSVQSPKNSADIQKY